MPTDATVPVLPVLPVFPITSTAPEPSLLFGVAAGFVLAGLLMLPVWYIILKL